MLSYSLFGRKIRLDKHVPRKHQRLQSCWNARQKALRELGYETYKQYLGSPLWRRLKQEALAAHPDCWACGNIATEVHHSKYTTQALLVGDGLVSVCRSCHQRASVKRNGSVRTAREATERLNDWRAAYLERERSRTATNQAAADALVRFGAGLAAQDRPVYRLIAARMAVTLADDLQWIQANARPHAYDAAKWVKQAIAVARASGCRGDDDDVAGQILREALDGEG